jgi:hypothetical protein
MTIQFSQYADGFRVRAQYVKPVERKLRHAAPRDIRPEEEARLDRVTVAADAVKDTLSERDGAEGGVKEALLLFIAAFTAMHDSLTATSSLPASTGERPSKAKRILVHYFPDGVSFTRAAAPAAWSEGARRIEDIEEAGLVGEIADLTGPDFFPAAKGATDALADVLGVGDEARPTPSGTALQLQLREFSAAVAAYTRSLAAAVDIDDDASVQRFVRAVAPIDEYRVEGRVRDDGDDESVTPAPAAPSTDAPVTPSTPAAPELDPTAPGGPFDPTIPD